MRRWIAGGLCLSWVVFAQPSAAQSNRIPRVAVAPFAGLRAELARSTVINALNDHAGEVELVSASDFDAAQERLGVAGMSGDEDFARVGRDLRLDEVVTGTVERRGRGVHLLLRVLRGRDGTSEATASWDVDRPEQIPALRVEIWDQIGSRFRTQPAPVRARPAPPLAPPSAPEPPSAPPPELPARTGEETSERTASEPTRGTEPATVASTTPGLGWLDLSAGGGLAGRSWRIPVLGEPTARGYDNSSFGELNGGVAVLYRVAQNRVGFGVEVAGTFPLGLSSQGRDTMGRPVTLSTSAFQVAGGLVAAYRPPAGGSMRLATGLVFQTFDVDTARLAPEMRLAKMTYVGLRVAAEGIAPVYAQQGLEFGVLFGGEFRWVSVGAEARQAFGNAPGATIGLGAMFGLALRLDRVAPGFGLRVAAEFMRYRTPFAGRADIGTGSDSVDDYTRFTLAMTYSVGSVERRPASTSTRYDGSQGAAEGTGASPPENEGRGPESVHDPFAPAR